LHREIGLAGLFASSNIPTSTRHALLAGAHHRCAEALPEASDAMDALVLMMLWSADAVEHGLVTPGASDHMHLAHVHVLRAHELLEECLAEGSIWHEKAGGLS
jgi:hypothetical protein